MVSRLGRAGPRWWALAVASGAGLAVVAMVFGVPIFFAVAAAVVTTGALAHRGRLPEAALLALSGGLMVAFLELGLRLAPALPTYYRPHEMLLGEGPYYRPNASIPRFEIAHGDIAAIWPEMPPEVREPRVVRFATDSLGFRNDADYRGQPYLAVGDSFVVGNGSDQDDTLSEVLTHRYGIATYSAAFPSGPEGYARMLRAVAPGAGAEPQAIVVIFEGNDLPCERGRRERRRWYRYVPGEIRRLETYRLVTGMVQRAWVRLHPDDGSIGVVHTVHGRPMAFLASYGEASRLASAKGCGWKRRLEPLAELRERIALLVYVPTKYRVFAPQIPGEPPLRTDARREFLSRFAQRHGLPFLDLTAPLTRAAATLEAAPGVYWRDDTHWAPAGIAVAARAIAADLESEAGAKGEAPAP